MSENLDKENQLPKSNGTRRGKAALLLNSDSSSDEEAGTAAGIYGNIIQATIKEREQNKQKHALVENELLAEKPVETLADEDEEVNTSDGDNDTDSEVTRTKQNKRHQSSSDETSSKQKISRDRSLSLSPPPVPVQKKAKAKRKSTTLVDRQLKALEKMMTTTPATPLDVFDCEQNQSELEQQPEINDTITVRVSARSGIQRICIERNTKFQEVYQRLSEIEGMPVESLTLKHRKRDEAILPTDTPASIDFLSVDIIDCEYKKSKVHERVEIVDKDEEVPASMVRIILQTRDGRKSRVKFLVARDEPLVNVIAKYCERMDMDAAVQYMLEFDGDIVGAAETAEDLDLDGDEIFDVKKNGKATMQLVEQHKDRYEFDDDVLIV